MTIAVSCVSRATVITLYCFIPPYNAKGTASQISIQSQYTKISQKTKDDIKQILEGYFLIVYLQHLCTTFT